MDGIVYFRGYAELCIEWYRYDLGAIHENPDEIEKIDPVAVLPKCAGWEGNWTVTAKEEICVVGGCVNGCTRRPSAKIRKHSPHTSPDNWDVFGDRLITRVRSIMAPVGDNLYLVAGIDQLGRKYRMSSQDWSKCGEVYNFVNKTWGYMKEDYEAVKGLVGTFAEGKIFFYGTDPSTTVSILSLDVISDQVVRYGEHPGFWVDNMVDLNYAILREILPAVSDTTFYWFTPDKCLHGYDFELKCWFHSQPLAKLSTMSSFKLYPPVLVRLNNGKFMAIVTNDPGKVSLVVIQLVGRSKESFTLDVCVEKVRSLCCPDSGIVGISDGMAVSGLTSHGSDSVEVRGSKRLKSEERIPLQHLSNMGNERETLGRRTCSESHKI